MLMVALLGRAGGSVPMSYMGMVATQDMLQGTPECYSGGKTIKGLPKVSIMLVYIYVSIPQILVFL